MVKSILLNLTPKQCYDIINGDVKMLVYKHNIKLEPPFTCYIYCRKPSEKSRYISDCLCFYTDELYRTSDRTLKYGSSIELMTCDENNLAKAAVFNGKVIGEFTCKRKGTIFYHSDILYGIDFPDSYTDDIAEHSGKSLNELKDIADSGDLTALYIDDLKIYDEPKSFGNFYKIIRCNKCKGRVKIKQEACNFFDNACEYFTELEKVSGEYCYICERLNKE